MQRRVRKGLASAHHDREAGRRRRRDDGRSWHDHALGRHQAGHLQGSPAVLLRGRHRPRPDDRSGQQQLRREVVAGRPVGSGDRQERLRWWGRLLQRRRWWGRLLQRRRWRGRLLQRRRRRLLGLELTQLATSQTTGARPSAGTSRLQSPSSPEQPRASGSGPIPTWAFAGMAICSFGGPLALAALSAPGLFADAGASTGLAMVASVVVFGAPLAIWLRYARHISSSGGLYAFVEAAVGRRLALAQAATWIVSYLLYLVYTTVQIVYDVLPAVVPIGKGLQTALALLIPIGIVGVMVAGRAAALLLLAAMAVGQVALAGVLDGVTVAHLSTPASAFTAGAPTGAVAKASAQSSLLYICGSLPLFLGGELKRPARTIRRGLTGTYLLTAVVISLAVVPLATSPGLMRTAIPGVTVARVFAGAGVAQAIGIGVAVSIAGVIVCEYVALMRLV